MRRTQSGLIVAAALALAGAAYAQEAPPAGEAPPEEAAAPSDDDDTSQGAASGEAAAQDAAGQDDAAPREAAAQDNAASEDPANQDGAAPEAAAAQNAAAEEEPPYTVECGPDPEEGTNVCQVDRGTYVGWRTFHSICHTCHAQDAVGSTFAPALLPRIRAMDKARFIEVVDQGFTGQVGVMPGWAANPNVNRYYEELWSYLRARADGELLPGRPKRLPDDDR